MADRTERPDFGPVLLRHRGDRGLAFQTEPFDTAKQALDRAKALGSPDCLIDAAADEQRTIWRRADVQQYSTDPLGFGLLIVGRLPGDKQLLVQLHPAMPAYSRVDPVVLTEAVELAKSRPDQRSFLMDEAGNDELLSADSLEIVLAYLD